MKLDRQIKEALKMIGTQLKGACPDEEAMAAFLEDKLPEAQRAEVAAHFLACNKCRDAASAAWGDIPKRLRVPMEVLRRATEALPARESKWEIIVKFADDFVEVLKNTGGRTQYFAPAFASARSGKTGESSLVACAENIGGIDTEIEIERVDVGLGEVKVVLKEGGGIPIPPVRVTLKSGNTELASYMAQEGTAVFERLPTGNYNILISRRGVSLGEIALMMKGE